MLKKLLMSLLLCAGLVTAQVPVDTGAPKFGAAAGGPFDLVNLGNLNAHWTIPIVSKPGRGASFLYALTYDTLMWQKVQVAGQWQWQPTGSWGWAGQTQPATGYLKIRSVTSTCDLPAGQSGTEQWRTFEYYVDRRGRRHNIGITLQSSDCGGENHTQEPTWLTTGPRCNSTSDSRVRIRRSRRATGA